jgi:hypothetical protein
MTSPLFTNDGDFYSKLRASATQDLMSLQMAPGLEDENTTTVTDPILPDRLVTDRLGHMDPELYDLSDESHLMRFLKVLLGGAGAGGLRKQIAVARLQNSFRGMHFLDLDRFYGALFGIKRTKAELMPDFGTKTRPAVFNPYTDATGSDTWDDVHSRDSSYRDRLIKFAKAIPHGGSYPGLKAAMEALFSVECEIYESWTLVDEQILANLQPPVLIYTYTALSQAYTSFDQIERGRTWSALNGGVGSIAGYFTGRTNQQNRSEVVIQPKRPILPSEAFQAMRVIERLKPAGVQLTINSEGLAVHRQVPLRGVAADSEYWEIIYKTTPAPHLVDPGPTQPIYVQPDPKKCQPRPAFAQYQGETICYNKEITRVSSYQMIQRSILTSTNYETVVFKSTQKSYVTSYAILDGTQALAARVVSDGVMTSFAYSSRVTVASTIKNVYYSRTTVRT